MKEKQAPIRWRLWLTLSVWVIVLTLSGLTVRKVHRFTLRDARFRLASPDERAVGLSMEGLAHTSRSAVLRAFAPDFGHSIFRLPLAERRRRLLAIDWVQNAAISRIWPNRVVVRITERKPVAFVQIPLRGSRGARPFLIDAEGVLLEPPAGRFHFPVLSGISDEQTEPERRERVHSMMRLMDEVGPLAKEVSEVNSAEPEDLRVVIGVEGRALELWMGDRNFGRRLENFLNHYPEIRKHSGNVTKFDLRLDGRVITKG